MNEERKNKSVNFPMFNSYIFSQLNLKVFEMEKLFFKKLICQQNLIWLEPILWQSLIWPDITICIHLNVNMYMFCCKKICAFDWEMLRTLLGLRVCRLIFLYYLSSPAPTPKACIWRCIWPCRLLQKEFRYVVSGKMVTFQIKRLLVTRAYFHNNYTNFLTFLCKI